jgi:ribA/ribD-fused uncharacterized protein
MSTSSPDRSRYILFWDHIPSPSNPYELAVFSQWFEAPFIDPRKAGATVYQTAEHWMMYHKAQLFDPSMCAAILHANTPAKAKALGRQIKNFDRDIWNKHANGIVQAGNWAKFHPASAPSYLYNNADADPDNGYEQRKEDAKKRWETLKATKGCRMVEASPDHSTDWGLNRCVNGCRD